MIEPSIWLAAEGVGAAVIAAVVTMWGSRRMFPFQSKKMAAEAQASTTAAAESAVASIRVALDEAHGRVITLEARVAALDVQIGELRGQLAAETQERRRIEEALNLSLAERAAMRQEIIDLRLQVTSGMVDLSKVGKPDAIVMVGALDGIISYANEGVYQLLGYTPTELVDKPLEVLVPEYLRGQHTRDRTNYSKAPRTRPMGTGIDLKARRRDGTVIDVDISLHPTGGDDGRIIALVKRRGE